MVITQKEARELAYKGRLERSARNLKTIYQLIKEHTEKGDNKMVISGTLLTSEVRKELLSNGYIVYPEDSSNYNNLVGVWIIYWGYSDEVIINN